MSINIYRDQMQHAQMFGKPVLTTNQPIPRETVPDGWWCYDMRGTDADPGAHAVLVDYASYLHSGTVLSPAPLKRPNTAERRIGRKDYFLHGEEMDLEAFCEEYDLKCPENPIKFEMRPASPDEAGIFIMKTSSQEGTAKQPASKGRQGMKHMSGGKPPCIWLPAKSLETF